MRILLAPKFKPSLFGEKFTPELMSIFEHARDDLGCLNVSFWGTRNDSKTPRLDGSVVASTYPITWIQKYAIFGYSSIDPVVKESMFTNAVKLTDFTEEAPQGLESFYKAVRNANIGEFSVSVPIHFSSDIRSVSTFMFSATKNTKVIGNHENLSKAREHAHRIASFIFTETGAEEKETPKLTSREVAILKALSKGQTYQEIAVMLDLSRWTIVAHAKSARTKLGARSNSEAVSLGQEQNLI